MSKMCGESGVYLLWRPFSPPQSGGTVIYHAWICAPRLV